MRENIELQKKGEGRRSNFSVNKLERFSFLVVFLDIAIGSDNFSYDQKKNEVWKTSDAFWEVSETS